VLCPLRAWAKLFEAIFTPGGVPRGGPPWEKVFRKFILSGYPYT